MSGTAPTGEERAFLRPAGFSTFAGERILDRQRVRALTFVFMRNLTHGLGRKLLLALALLPGLSVAAYALLRGWAGDKAGFPSIGPPVCRLPLPVWVHRK